MTKEIRFGGVTIDESAMMVPSACFRSSIPTVVSEPIRITCKLTKTTNCHLW